MIDLPRRPCPVHGQQRVKRDVPRNSRQRHSPARGSLTLEADCTPSQQRRVRRLLLTKKNKEQSQTRQKENKGTILVRYVPSFRFASSASHVRNERKEGLFRLRHASTYILHDATHLTQPSTQTDLPPASQARRSLSRIAPFVSQRVCSPCS